MDLRESSTYNCPLVGDRTFKWIFMDYDHVCAHYDNRPENCDQILETCEHRCEEKYHAKHRWRRDGWLNLKGRADRTRNRAMYFLKMMNLELDRLAKGQKKAVGDYAVASKVSYEPILKENA